MRAELSPNLETPITDWPGMRVCGLELGVGTLDTHKLACSAGNMGVQ